MKKVLTLIAIAILTGVLSPTYADTINYRIKQEGSSMVIVPYYPDNFIQKTVPEYKPAPAPAQIPYYSNKNLPKCKNRNKVV